MHPVVSRDPWAPYRPSARAPWNVRRVVHLHRRAGFAATWGEIERDVADGPEASIARVLAGAARDDADFERRARHVAEAALRRDFARDSRSYLQAWWILRMARGRDPLGERLALLWHDHFATSDVKVRDQVAMHRQNELFRRFGRARFAELLTRVTHDPALLEWLDAPLNAKGHPNENLARELMELFTLGLGHFTETDVREAARALTGWAVAEGQFVEVLGRHDAEPKTILGTTGNLGGDDLLRILLDHPATARRLAFRICELLMGETGTDAGALDALAASLRESGLDVGRALATVLRSERFFRADNLGTRVLGPCEFVVGAVRALELTAGPVSTVTLAEWVLRIGQDLFRPPNVGGWAQGRAWLDARTLIARMNFVTALLAGELVAEGGPFDALGLARAHRRGDDTAQVVGFCTELLLGGEPRAGWVADVQRQIGEVGRDEAARRAIALILTAPEGQLG